MPRKKGYSFYNLANIMARITQHVACRRNYARTCGSAVLRHNAITFQKHASCQALSKSRMGGCYRYLASRHAPRTYAQQRCMCVIWINARVVMRFWCVGLCVFSIQNEMFDHAFTQDLTLS